MTSVKIASVQATASSTPLIIDIREPSGTTDIVDWHRSIKVSQMTRGTIWHHTPIQRFSKREISFARRLVGEFTGFEYSIRVLYANAVAHDLPLTPEAKDVLRVVNCHRALKAILDAFRETECYRLIEKIDGWVDIEDPTWREVILVFDTERFDDDERLDLWKRTAEVIQSVVEKRADLREMINSHIGLDI